MTSQQHTVIVGGSSGIGLSTARMLLGLGHRVTITGRNASRLTDARNTLSGDIHTLVMDAAVPSELPGAFERIGSFSHLVLALGSSRGAGPFASVSLEDVKAGFEEKVYAHFATAQAAIPGTAGIGAANAAVAALVPVLAAELRPLRVNAVSPGVIDTPWWDFLPEDDKSSVFADYASKTPVGRTGLPEDITQAITFIISDTFVSGQTIICDGGLRLTA